MSLGVVPVMGDFVGEVSGIDLARPLDPRALATIIDAIDRFGVLVFRARQSTTTRSRLSAGSLDPCSTPVPNSAWTSR